MFFFVLFLFDYVKNITSTVPDLYLYVWADIDWMLSDGPLGSLADGPTSRRALVIVLPCYGALEIVGVVYYY